MNHQSRFPGPLGEWLGVGGIALAAHLAVLAGGVVRPEGILPLRDLARAPGMAGAALRTLAGVAGDPAAPFAAMIGWALLGLAALYAAARRLLTPFFASAVLVLVLAAGYPGWRTLMPAEWIIWFAPISGLALAVSYPLGRVLSKPLARVVQLTSGRWWKVGWALLVVVSGFIVAERVRLGLRADHTARFPYVAAGLPRGFDKELADLRAVTHLTGFTEALNGIQEAGLRANDPAHCLRAHGAAARYLCRVGMTWGASRAPMTRRYLSSTGWQVTRQPRNPGFNDLMLNRGNRVLAPEPGRGGLRYPRLWGFVNGEPSGNWFDTRARVLREHPQRVEIRGPTFRRAANRNLWIEIECTRPEGVRMTVKLNEQELPVQRRDLPAGDRIIVRGVTLLAGVTCPGGQPLAVSVEVPTGMLDFDLLIAPEEQRAMTR